MSNFGQHDQQENHRGSGRHYQESSPDFHVCNRRYREGSRNFNRGRREYQEGDHEFHYDPEGYHNYHNFHLGCRDYREGSDNIHLGDRVYREGNDVVDLVSRHSQESNRDRHKSAHPRGEHHLKSIPIDDVGSHDKKGKKKNHKDGDTSKPQMK